MLRRNTCVIATLLVAAATTAASFGPANGSVSMPGYPSGPPGAHAGPPYKFMTELMSYAPNLGLRDKMILARTKLGYRLWSGGEDSHLTITLVNTGHALKILDTGTKSFKRLSPTCERLKVKGIGAICHVPNDLTARKPLLIEVWPRLGNDYTDTSTLPATFSVSVLSDEGNDTALLGAGRDFFNGHMGRDRVWGGAGNDWIRGGLGNDLIYGGAGNDDIVGMQGSDTVSGGDGKDRIWGSQGPDRLNGGESADFMICGDGHDRADVDGGDFVSQNCETVNQRRPDWWPLA